MNDKIKLWNKEWVTDDGSYGTKVYVFDRKDLADWQYDALDELSDSDRAAYVLAILSEDGPVAFTPEQDLAQEPEEGRSR
jgi:nitrous oxide reductase accessory protein NosL